jgi:hypothetical protein
MRQLGAIRLLRLKSTTAAVQIPGSVGKGYTGKLLACRPLEEWNLFWTAVTEIRGFPAVMKLARPHFFRHDPGAIQTPAPFSPAEDADRLAASRPRRRDCCRSAKAFTAWRNLSVTWSSTTGEGIGCRDFMKYRGVPPDESETCCQSVGTKWSPIPRTGRGDAPRVETMANKCT